MDIGRQRAHEHLEALLQRVGAADRKALLAILRRTVAG
jgi:hypothetical protein